MGEAATGTAESSEAAAIRPEGAPGLTLSSHITSTYAAVTVSGELDIATADRLFEYVLRVIERTDSPVVLDLAEVEFCDASGLRSLVQIGKHAKAAGRRIVLAEPTPLMARILRLGNLAQRFATVPKPWKLLDVTSAPAPATTVA